MSVKTCSICSREKPETDYYRVRESGTPYGPCKECRRDSANARHATRREQARTNFEQLAGHV